MELVTSKTELCRVLASIQSIVEKRNTMPILANVLLSGADDILKASATDLEITASLSLPAKTSKPGSTTVNAKVLYEVIRELPEEEVSIKLGEGERVEISSGRAKTRIIGISAEEYPSLPGLGLKVASQIEAGQFLEMINKTIYAVSQDETRFNLSGVCFDIVGNPKDEDAKSLRLVATDGHRLAMISRPVSGLSFKKSVLVPRKGLLEIKKLLETEQGNIGVEISEGFMVVEIGNSRPNSAKLSMRLIDAEFPDYKQVIPKDKGTIATADSTVLSNALRRVALMVTDKTKGVRMDFVNGALKISSSSPELGDASEEIEVKYDGDPVSVGFNAKYLLDISASLGEKAPLNIELHGALGPGRFFVEGDESYIAVVMPMRLL